MIGPHKRILVTGGAGFIGSHLTETLRLDRCEVVVLDDLSMGRRENLHEAVEFHQGDVRDEDALRRALKGVDAVIHLAAKVSVRASTDDFINDASVNVLGTLSALKACAGTGVRKFVYASSMAVYADSPEPKPINEDYACRPISPYGVGKLASENYVLDICPRMGVAPVVLRLFNTYGQGQTFTPYVGVITIFIRRLLNSEPPIVFGSGEQCRDYISVDDAVTACGLALESDCGGQVFNIGTGTPVSVNALAEKLCELINPEIKPVHEAERPGELRNCIADAGKARRMMGYNPLGHVFDQLEDLIDYHKSLK
ncbi:MAG: NAD-dependent epimerase/dehydratase family protein [Phycisphaerales bacterium]|nr:NAD-dependent epimerase/dehydratase family protein [Phycisphaerales bacterium]